MTNLSTSFQIWKLVGENIIWFSEICQQVERFVKVLSDSIEKTLSESKNSKKNHKLKYLQDLVKIPHVKRTWPFSAKIDPWWTRKKTIGTCCLKENMIVKHYFDPLEHGKISYVFLYRPSTRSKFSHIWEFFSISCLFWSTSDSFHCHRSGNNYTDERGAPLESWDSHH